MRYFREVWNEECREFDRIEVDRREARRLLYGNYKDVDLCLNTEGYYKLMTGGVEVAKSGTEVDTLKAILERTGTGDIFRALIPILIERGADISVHSHREKTESGVCKTLYDTYPWNRKEYPKDTKDCFERAIKGLEEIATVQIWTEREK